MKLHLRTDSPYLVPRYDFWPALIAAGVSIGSTIYSAYSQNKANKQNKEYADKANEFTREQYEYDKAFTREQYDYNKQLNSVIMEREDNAYQRAVEDARAAGLSPLTVAGSGGANAGGTVSQSNLSNGSYSLQTPNVQAPQIEANTFASMMNSLEQQAMQQRQIDADTKSQQSEQSFEFKKQSAQLDAQDKMLDKELENARTIQDKVDRQKELDRVENRKIFNATQRNIMEARTTQELSAASHEGMKAAANLGVKNFQFFTDRAKYEQALAARSVGAQTRASDAWRMTEGYDETTTNAGSRSVGASLSASASPSTYGLGASDIGTSASVSGSSSGNSTQTLHSSAVQMMNQAEVEYWNKNGYPVFVGSYHHEDVK